MMYYGMGGWGSFMMIIPLLFIGIIIYAVYQLVIDKKNNEMSSRTAEDILAERFAKGEISEEEYKRMKDVLKQ